MSTINSLAGSKSPKHASVLKSSGKFSGDMHKWIFHSEYTQFLDTLAIHKNLDDSDDTILRIYKLDSDRYTKVEKSTVIIESSTSGTIIGTEIYLESPSSITPSEVSVATKPQSIKYESKKLSGITLDEAIVKITSSTRPDPVFVKVFIACFRHIVDSKGLLERLITRIETKFKTDDPTYKWRPLILLRSIEFVYQWIKTLWLPDFTSNESKRMFDRFIDVLASLDESDYTNNEFDLFSRNAFRNLAKKLAILAQQFEHLETAGPKLPAIADNLVNVIPVALKAQFLDCEPEEIALALLENDSKCFGVLQPVDFLIRLWQDESQPGISKRVQSINHLIQSFVCAYLTLEYSK